MRNATLVTHTPVAKATIIFFLSQMAILMASISFTKTTPEGDVHAKHDQQRSRSGGHVSKDLEDMINEVRGFAAERSDLSGYARTVD